MLGGLITEHLIWSTLKLSILHLRRWNAAGRHQHEPSGTWLWPTRFDRRPPSPDKPGRYLVICAVHPHFVDDGMFGFVKVTEQDRDD